MTPDILLPELDLLLDKWSTLNTLKVVLPVAFCDEKQNPLNLYGSKNKSCSIKTCPSVRLFSEATYTCSVHENFRPILSIAKRKKTTEGQCTLQ